MKAIKITEPRWLPLIAMKVNALSRKVPTKGVTYESLIVFLQQVIQFGGDNSELWAVFSNGKPVAFGRWEVRLLPHVGKVYGDCFYSWARSQKPMELLIDEFIKFGKNKRATLYEMDITDERVYKHIEKIAKKKGATLERQNRINCIGTL